MRHIAIVVTGLSVAFAAGTLIAAEKPGAAGAKPAPVAANKAAKPAPAAPVSPGPVNIPGYEAVMIAANIALTPATMAHSDVHVNGQPRMTQRHPRTLWDQQDIDEYKTLLKSNEELKKDYGTLLTLMNKRVGQPMGVPDVSPKPPTRDEYRQHGANSMDMSMLGIAYVLTGDEKYGEFCRQMLLTYARNYPRYSHSEGWSEKKYRSAHDGRLTGQFLDDGFWLMRVAFAYDLVYNLPSWTQQERALIKDDLFNAVASEFSHPVLGNLDYYGQAHNRSALCTAAVLMAGYACDDEKLVNLALYGVGGTKESPKGGVFGTHFTSQCILPDGLWLEGAPAYQLGIASCGIFNVAETLWHHGIDMYRYDNGMLKRLLDSAIALSYPDDKMTVAALHDSGRSALLDDRNWMSNEAGLPYACGYRRYGDPRYIPIVRNMSKKLAMTIHAGAPSLYFNFPPENTVPARELDHANFFSVGYGVMRLASPAGPNQIIMEFGPSGSHGHPSKLAYDLYAFGDTLMPFPGVIFPYNHPLDPKWYWTTLSNNALTVDEKSQLTWGNKWRYPKGTPNPEAKQQVFAPAGTFGMQRAWSDNLYLEKLIQDRALFSTSHYLADLFGAFAASPHKYDLAWHFRGTLKMSVSMTPMSFPEDAPDGYNGLTDVQRGSAHDAWSASIQSKMGKPVKLLAPGGVSAELLTGKGHFFIDSIKNDELPPTVIERRENTSNAIFGSVIDLSGDAAGYVKSLTQEGGLEQGFAALVITTEKGKDICLASYRPGQYSAGGMTTDGQQALALADGSSVRALYLAGGTSLSVPGGKIGRDAPGLAYVEKLPDGRIVLGNPSPSDAEISVTFPALANLSGAAADIDGKSVNLPAKADGDGALKIRLKAGMKVEFKTK